MSSLKERLFDYWEPLTGDRLDLVAEEASSLPLFLRERYAVFSTLLFGRKSFLALEAKGWETGSPGEYQKHADTLHQALHGPVILVLPILPSYARNRMVQMGLPFIVPGSQTFLPNRLIDLRERFPQTAPKPREMLSPAAQCTVLYHLLRHPLTGIPLREIAQKVRYSPMMMSKVKDELEAAKVCRVVRSGRSVVLDFPTSGRGLWDQVMPRLASPVKRQCWINCNRPQPSALLAGVSALSRRSMIADSRLPTYAMIHTAFQDCLEQGECVGCRDAETATARVEVWSYDPQTLHDQVSPTVDVLSLYLSLRDTADERVQQQLDRLIEEVKW